MLSRHKSPMLWILALTVALSGCRRKPQAESSAMAQAANVSVWKVQTGRIVQRIEVTGDVQPLSVVHLAAKVGGRLERLGVPNERDGYQPVSEGSYVKQGDVVARIDRAVYEARFRQAEAALAMAKAQARDAEREWKRWQRLYEEGSATEQMVDKAETAFAVAEAALSQAEAALKLARIELDESELKSPVSGVVARKHVDEGNLVGPNTPLLTIEDISSVKILAGVAERYVSSIAAGRTPVAIRSDSLPNDMVITAVVAKVYPALDPLTRNATVEIVVDNESGLLRSGNFVRVQLDVAEAEDVVVIPYSAVVWQGRDGFVFLVENGRAVRRPVKVGIRELDRCQILDGLAPGDLLVVEGYRGLKDGDPVVPVMHAGESS